LQPDSYPFTRCKQCVFSLEDGLVEQGEETKNREISRKRKRKGSLGAHSSSPGGRESSHTVGYKKLEGAGQGGRGGSWSCLGDGFLARRANHCMGELHTQKKTKTIKKPRGSA